MIYNLYILRRVKKVLFHNFQAKKEWVKTKIKGSCQYWHFEGPLNKAETCTYSQVDQWSLLTHFTTNSMTSPNIFSSFTFEILKICAWQKLKTYQESRYSETSCNVLSTRQQNC